jgi:hypothetical protein
MCITLRFLDIKGIKDKIWKPQGFPCVNWWVGIDWGWDSHWEKKDIGRSQ